MQPITVLGQVSVILIAFSLLYCCEHYSWQNIIQSDRHVSGAYPDGHRIASLCAHKLKIDQFRYIKIQPKTTDLSTKLWGIDFVEFIPQSAVLSWIFMIYRNWSIQNYFFVYSFLAQSEGKRAFNFQAKEKPCSKLMCQQNLIQKVFVQTKILSHLRASKILQ